MKRLLALTCVVLELLAAGCASSGSFIPPVNTPSPIVLATMLSSDWTALQQVPLHIPALAQGKPCPVVPGYEGNPALGAELGAGPLYLVGLGTQGVFDLGQAGWQNGAYSVSVLLTMPPPADATNTLVRGQQMDGSGGVLFNVTSGSSPSDQLQLTPAAAGTTAGVAGNWLTWSFFLMVSGAGCYGLQIDGAQAPATGGTGFSEIIVFKAG